MRFIFGLHHRPNPRIILEPLCDSEMEYVLQRESSRYKSVVCLPGRELVWGPRLEVSVVETLKIQNSDFEFVESLWQVATPKVSLHLANLKYFFWH